MLAQGYPGVMRIVLAVGPSEDGTEALAAEISRDDDRVAVVDNPAGITPAALNAAIGGLGIGRDDSVVVYSSETLMWATRAFWVLRYAGHDRVRILHGGLRAWRERGGALERQERRYPATTFSGVLRPEMIASKDEVLAAIERSGVCTIKSRNQCDSTAIPITSATDLFLGGTIRKIA